MLKKFCLIFILVTLGACCFPRPTPTPPVNIDVFRLERIYV